MKSSSIPRSHHFATPVWGTDFTRTFITATLPSLLAPGNIPFLGNRGSVYKIFTDTDGENEIRSSSAFAALSRHVEVQFRPITKVDANPYIASSSCYRTATIEAAAAQALIYYLIPDMILADGSMRSISQSLEQGKRAVMVAGMRVAKDSFVNEVLRAFRSGDSVVAPPRDLVAVALKHLHPMMRNHMYDDAGESFNPSLFCWPVAGEGYVLRCAHLHPVALDLQGQRPDLHGTIDDDLLFDLGLTEGELAFADDSDGVLWFELSDVNRTIPASSGKRLWEILRWLNDSTYSHQREYLKKTLRVHVAEVTEKKWIEVEARADQVIQTVLSAYELEKHRINHAPDKYALPTPLHIDGTGLSQAPGPLIEKLMQAMGAASITNAFIDALESRAHSFLAHSASRRLGNALIKRTVAKGLIVGASALRASLRLLNRRS